MWWAGSWVSTRTSGASPWTSRRIRGTNEVAIESRKGESRHAGVRIKPGFELEHQLLVAT